MFCPKCGTQVPSDANFCMSCGTDLSQYQQQESSGGGVNTGDVGMMKDSQMESTESQQQASIEQNPTINIQLGEIIRESVSEAMQQGKEEQRQAYERIQETSVSVTPEIADLLKKAKYATSDEEAEKYYDEILDVDLDNDIAWYQKFLLNWPTKYQIAHEDENFLDNSSNIRECLRDIMDARSARFDDWEKGRLHYSKLKEAIAYFENAIKADPSKFNTCPTCDGRGLGGNAPCTCTLREQSGKCHMCDGTGKCKGCGGSGIWEIVPGERVECPSCRSSKFVGKCHYCWDESGTGACKECGGSGYNTAVCYTCFGMGEVRVSDS